MKKILPVLLFAFAIFLFIIFVQSPTPQEQTTQEKHTTTSLYPDASLTPGETFSNVTVEQICTKGYTTTVRNVPFELKKEVYSEYNISYPQAKGAYEVDHFIPLELGGNNDIKNLWLESASPTPGFHEKDIVENYLRDQVCNGSLSLQTAQNEIQKDWYKVYTSIPNKNAYKY